MTKPLTTSEFIQKAKQVHNNKYDYSLVEYLNAHTKVKIICPIHGLFEQTPNTHLSNSRCLKCGLIHKNLLLKSNSSEFIQKSKQIHGNKYDYSLIVYKNNYIKVKIICPIHGIFEQKPNTHLSGSGCKKCGKNRSIGEEKLENWLKRENIKYIQEYRFHNCKNKNTLPFDFYLPDYNICVEFDGLQHYEPTYGLKTLLRIIKTDSIKTEYCKNNNIKLIRIPYWESKNIDQILSKEFLLDKQEFLL